MPAAAVHGRKCVCVCVCVCVCLRRACCLVGPWSLGSLRCSVLGLLLHGWALLWILQVARSLRVLPFDAARPCSRWVCGLTASGWRKGTSGTSHSASRRAERQTLRFATDPQVHFCDRAQPSQNSVCVCVRSPFFCLLVRANPKLMLEWESEYWLDLAKGRWGG